MVLTVMVLAGVFLSALLWIGFARLNKRLAKQHANQLSTLSKQLDRHRSQINYRHRHLDNYHFIERNLDEALVPQWDIRLENVT